jgi:hypothetical protein
LRRLSTASSARHWIGAKGGRCSVAGGGAANSPSSARWRAAISATASSMLDGAPLETLRGMAGGTLGGTLGETLLAALGGSPPT